MPSGNSLFNLPTGEADRDPLFAAASKRFTDLPERPRPIAQGFDVPEPWFPVPDHEQRPSHAKNITKRVASILAPLIGLAVVMTIIGTAIYTVYQFYN